MRNKSVCTAVCTRVVLGLVFGRPEAVLEHPAAGLLALRLAERPGVVAGPYVG
jgi:hypothetical protein